MEATHNKHTTRILPTLTMKLHSIWGAMGEQYVGRIIMCVTLASANSFGLLSVCDILQAAKLHFVLVLRLFFWFGRVVGAVSSSYCAK